MGDNSEEKRKRERNVWIKRFGIGSTLMAFGTAGYFALRPDIVDIKVKNWIDSLQNQVEQGTLEWTVQSYGAGSFLIDAHLYSMLDLRAISVEEREALSLQRKEALDTCTKEAEVRIRGQGYWGKREIIETLRTCATLAKKNRNWEAAKQWLDKASAFADTEDAHRSMAYSYYDLGYMEDARRELQLSKVEK